MANKTIDGTANITAVRFKESAAPSTPASGYGKVYEKSDGKLYFKNDAGTESDLTATGGAGSDADAIHNNVASEIDAITEKESTVDADLLLIEDSADSNNKKKLQVQNLFEASSPDFLRLQEQGSAPSTPASGYGAAYATTDGLRYIDDSGNIFYSMLGGWIYTGETWTYASADDPTFTFTASGDKTGEYSAGMRVRLTQSTGGTKFFIVTKVVFDDPGSTITIYGGTDYNLENEAITDPAFSWSKAPHGFPLSPAAWSVKVTDTTIRSQASPTDNVWYNLGSISIDIPIGVWRVRYQVASQGVNGNADTLFYIKTTLSTGNNSETDSEFTVAIRNTPEYSTTGFVGMSQNREGLISIATKDTYYLNILSEAGSIDTLYFLNSVSDCIIEATCAYL